MSGPRHPWCGCPDSVDLTRRNESDARLSETDVVSVNVMPGGAATVHDHLLPAGLTYVAVKSTVGRVIPFLGAEVGMAEPGH